MDGGFARTRKAVKKLVLLTCGKRTLLILDLKTLTDYPLETGGLQA
jgi:hypothetical protein